MERLKSMKEQLVSVVQTQLGDIKSVDAKELGEAIDMIKDLAQAIYYCTITEAMDEEGTEKKYKHYKDERYDYDDHEMRYYPRKPYYDDDWRDSRYEGDYKPERYRDYEYSRDITRRDPKEGRSPVSRKMYMESKEMHKDQSKKMQDLETYVQELTSDLIEMIADATPEEKQLLKTKISTLSTKIA